MRFNVNGVDGDTGGSGRPNCKNAASVPITPFARNPIEVNAAGPGGGRKVSADLHARPDRRHSQREVGDCGDDREERRLYCPMWTY
jgi:hypothetical protein